MVHNCHFSIHSSYNLRASLRGCFFYILGLVVPLLLLAAVLASNLSNDIIDSIAGKEPRIMLRGYLVCEYLFPIIEFTFIF